MTPAVFLDRDGVLNAIVRRGETISSPRTPEELVLEPEAESSLRALKRRGLPLFVVTNQPDVRRGLMTPAALDEIHRRLRSALPVDDIAACLHDNADACACRKPKPGLLLDLAQRHGIDLARSWMVGDQDRDIACGRAAGCRTILLRRTYNSGLAAEADLVVESLSEAAAAILAADPDPAQRLGPEHVE
ncbi:D-glycero-alpha-D-manno-heptose-1,7-bisphosphate 7-phosphatase [Phenylobacterium sp. VNQ135]|uniref:D-glycero-alpha-D-manno-heptose-1,7-bisphosphate 7-phosphatase n=1 Tax=Phenylobacterium sp. VNQ135 TaxID=3400922 RepID=UPI003C059C40